MANVVRNFIIGALLFGLVVTLGVNFLSGMTINYAVSTNSDLSKYIVNSQINDEVSSYQSKMSNGTLSLFGTLETFYSGAYTVVQSLGNTANIVNIMLGSLSAEFKLPAIIDITIKIIIVVIILFAGVYVWIKSNEV